MAWTKRLVVTWLACEKAICTLTLKKHFFNLESEKPSRRF